MCGIAGMVTTKEIDSAIIEAMTMSLSHRGPDARGIFVEGENKIALGQTRLSIIDLSSSANQPFYSSNGRYVIVFNGEVYNFQTIKNELTNKHGVTFRTHSDTEVIVEAFVVWGKNMVNRLDGMFAIAIVDKQEQKIFLFRDRMGKKPLYYFHSNSLFAFASEIKSLLKHPTIQREKEIDVKRISSFLHLGYIHEPYTIYKHISKFPSGHVGEINLALKLSLEPYWCINDAVKEHQYNSKEEAKLQLTNLLDDAVKKRLISDVPLGTFLSGGTDSSLVTALAARHTNGPLKTFSIGFKEDKFDESHYAREVAQYLKTDHAEFILAEKEAINLLEIYLQHFDEPFADTSTVPTMLVSKLASREVKVALTGDGGDELFQGYGSYVWANRLENSAWKLIREPVRRVLEISGKSRFERIAHLMEDVPKSGIRSHIFSQEQYFFTQRELQEHLFKDKTVFNYFEYDETMLSKNISAGERQAFFDLQFYLKDDLLVKVDRASMYYGLECRCPLLDYHVVEYALSIDSSLKFAKNKTKWLLKEILYEFLPKRLVDRPKWGFSVPLAKWLKTDLKYLIDDFLNDSIIDELGLFNKTYIQQLKKEFFAGKEYLYNRLWVIIVIHKWLKANQ